MRYRETFWGNFEYDGPVDYAKNIYEGHRIVEIPPWKKPFDFSSSASHRTVELMVLGERLLEDDPQALVRRSSEDARYFDALRIAIARHLHREPLETLPPPAIGWLLEFLLGELERPKGRSGRWKPLGQRGLVANSVRLVVLKFGISATRNDASPPQSACDYVAQALSELGREPTTYEGVKRIWLEVESERKSKF